MKTFIGIDPGKSGGISWICDGKACAEKMPLTLVDLWELLSGIWAEDGVCRAFLEQVQPGGLSAGKQGKMGAKSAFTFGNGFGHLEMALTALRIPFERVPPQKWQKSLGCMTGGNKNVSKAKAQELFPSIKCTHAISDSLLIAEYGRRLNL